MPAPIPVNDQILALHNAGVPTRQIEKVIGTLDHSTIARRLKHLTPRKTTEIFKSMRADIFSEKQRKLMMLGDRATIKEQRDLATAVGIYYDKEQLERGHGVDARPLVMIQINTNRATNDPKEPKIDISTVP